jgi:hypothetical protein
LRNDQACYLAGVRHGLLQTIADRLTLRKAHQFGACARPI